MAVNPFVLYLLNSQSPDVKKLNQAHSGTVLTSAFFQMSYPLQFWLHSDEIILVHVWDIDRCWNYAHAQFNFSPELNILPAHRNFFLLLKFNFNESFILKMIENHFWNYITIWPLMIIWDFSDWVQIYFKGYVCTYIISKTVIFALLSFFIVKHWAKWIHQWLVGHANFKQYCLVTCVYSLMYSVAEKDDQKQDCFPNQNEKLYR